MQLLYAALPLLLIGAAWGASGTWTALENGDTVTIAVVGSSWAATQTAQWPQMTVDGLDSLFPGRVHLDNKGVPGKQFESILNDFLSCMAASSPPTAIFVEFHFHENNKSDLQNYPDSAAYYADHLRQALRQGKALAPQSDIVVWMPYRICQAMLDYGPITKILDSARAVASAEGIPTADNWPAFERICSDPCCSRYSEFLYDGSHTTEIGGAIVSSEAIRVLRDVARDSTAPSLMPLNVHAQAINNRSVLLTWDALGDGADPQSGIAGYAVKRNDEWTGTIRGGLSTSFLDTTVSELTTYSYTVFSFNNQLIEGPASQSASASTPADHNPPQLCKVYSWANSHYAALMFDEPLDSENASNPKSYSVQGCGEATILRAALQPGGMSVVVESDSALAKQNVTVTVTGLMDAAHEPNSITTSQTMKLTTGIINSGLYFRTVGDLSLSNAKNSPVFLIQKNPYALQGTASGCSGTLAAKFNNLGGLLQGFINIQTTGRYWFYTTFNADTAEFAVGAASPKSLAGQVQDSLAIDAQAGLTPMIMAAFNFKKNPLSLSMEWAGPGFARSSIADSLLFYQNGDSSTANFQGHFISPAAGQAVRPGDSVLVAWAQDNSSQVFDLMFEVRYTGSTWRDILSSSISSALGRFSWPIPDSIGGVSWPADSVVIRGYQYGHPENNMVSRSFTISRDAPGHIKSSFKVSKEGKMLVRTIARNVTLISLQVAEHGRIKIISLQGRTMASAILAQGANRIEFTIPAGAYLFSITGKNAKVRHSGRIMLGVK